MSTRATQAEFLYQSIADAQAIIRGIDVKLGFLLLVVFSPLFAFDKLGGFLGRVFQESSIQSGLLTVSCLFWIGSTVAQLAALAAISNPATKIKGSTGHGIFFGGDLYHLMLIDVFFNRNIKSQKTLSEEIDRLPKSDEQFIAELVLEKMKVVYIRTIKAKRLNAALWLLIAWLATGLISYLIHLSN